jgi:glucokinase-like ROK family protein
MKKSNQEETRLHNSCLVLSTIYNSIEISRVEIARHTKLTRTTVSEIVAEFIAEGLVVESGLSPSTGGKPATLLRVEENSRLLVGIDLAEREICGALVNLRGQIVHRFCNPLEARDGETALLLVYDCVDELLKLADQPVIGIGIGVPGLMDPANGIVRQAVHLDWHNLPLGDLLQARFQLPVYLANDCQVAALGEFTFGASSQGDNLIVIKTGRGTGAGIVLNGQLYYGDNAGAGEIGHVQVVENGEPCRCGQRGCLETVVGSRALLESSRKLAVDNPDSILNRLSTSLDGINLETLSQALQEGDSQVASLIEQAGRTLGRAITHLVGILNINRILIAGSLSRFGEVLVEPIRQQVRVGTLPELAQQTEVGLASLGNDIVILGAASLILKSELGLF